MTSKCTPIQCITLGETERVQKMYPPLLSLGVSYLFYNGWPLIFLGEGEQAKVTARLEGAYDSWTRNKYVLALWVQSVPLTLLSTTMFNLQINSGFTDRANRRTSFVIFATLSSIFFNWITICSRYCELTKIHISVSTIFVFYPHWLLSCSFNKKNLLSLWGTTPGTDDAERLGSGARLLTSDLSGGEESAEGSLACCILLAGRTCLFTDGQLP